MMPSRKAPTKLQTEQVPTISLTLPRGAFRTLQYLADEAVLGNTPEEVAAHLLIGALYDKAPIITEALDTTNGR
jgi:hypothetical protein